MKVIDAVEKFAMFRVRILLLAVGFFCILFPTTFCDFIPLIVGVSMMIVGAFGIFVGFETRNYKTPEISGLGDAVVLTLLGFVIVISQNASLLLLGVIWDCSVLEKVQKRLTPFYIGHQGKRILSSRLLSVF